MEIDSFFFKRLHLHFGDVTDGTSLRRVLTRVQPTEVYNLAAQSHVAFDSAKPSGAPRKVLDCSLATRLGWRARTPLREGLERTYAEMCA